MDSGGLPKKRMTGWFNPSSTGQILMRGHNMEDLLTSGLYLQVEGHLQVKSTFHPQHPLPSPPPQNPLSLTHIHTPALAPRPPPPKINTPNPLTQPPQSSQSAS